MRAARPLNAGITALVLIIFGVPLLSQAQDLEETCPVIAASAIATMETSCANLGANNTCYGSDDILANFRDPVPEGTFDAAGDQTDLTNLEAVQTRTIDLRERTWGLNVMNVQATVPRILSDSGIIMILLGGVEVEDDIEPADAFMPPEEGVAVSTIAAAELRQATMTPPANSDIIDTVPAGQTLTADVLSVDGNWLRVVYNGRPGWLSRGAISPDSDLTLLKLFSSDSWTPMQSFFFRVGIGGQPCAPIVPSFLFLQGPAEFPVDIRVHMVDLRIQGSAILRTLSPGDQLGDAFEINVLSGIVVINPDTAFEVIVPAGYTTQIGLGQFVSLGIEGDVDEKLLVGGWSAIRRLTQEELNFFGLMTAFSFNMLYDDIEIPVIVQASGVGGVVPQINFSDPSAIVLVQQACDLNLLADADCQYFGF